MLANLVIAPCVNATATLSVDSAKKSSFVKNNCIKNFHQTLCGSFDIVDSVIVKTALNKKDLIQKLSKPVKQIAFLKNAGLYVVPANDALRYANKIAQETYIIYAQPNILQARKLHHKKTNDVTSQYHLNAIWQTTQGEGIKIAVIDDGFNLAHEDLQGITLAFEYDVEQKKLNSSPKINRDTHGTQVAGIIFAQHNGIGIDGIAPKAELIAIRQVSNLTSATILAFTVANLAKADIINCSWHSPVLLEPVYDVIKDIAARGREGKGTAIIFAAGNSAKPILPYSTEAAIDDVVVVGTDQTYSNYGKFVDFIIPTNVRTTKANAYGVMGGTSAAAPVLSGLLALKMAKNRHLPSKHIIQQLKRTLYGR